jgi:hypothetical protein
MPLPGSSPSASKKGFSGQSARFLCPAPYHDHHGLQPPAHPRLRIIRSSSQHDPDRNWPLTWRSPAIIRTCAMDCVVFSLFCVTHAPAHAFFPLPQAVSRVTLLGLSDQVDLNKLHLFFIYYILYDPVSKVFRVFAGARALERRTKRL